MMTTYAVLRSPIPLGGFGRPLTRTERRELADEGQAVPVATVVIRQVETMDYYGELYECDEPGRYRALNVRVETR